MPDRAGVKLSTWDIVLLVLRFLPTLPRMIANRPSVVDPKIQEVGVPSLYALLLSQTRLDSTVHQEDQRRERLREGRRRWVSPSQFVIHTAG